MRLLRPVTFLLAVVSMATASLVAPASVVAHGDEAGTGEGSEIPFKALADVAVQIDASSLTAGSDVIVDLGTRSGVVGVSVELSATGGVVVDTDPVPVVVEGVTAATVGALTSVEGSGSITAMLTGVDRTGQRVMASDRVWVDRVGDSLVVSEIGTQDLAVQVAEVLEATGQVGAETAGKMRDAAISGSTTGAEPEFVATSAAATACNPGDVCLSGTAQWTDRDGGLHVIAGADVEIMESNAGADQVIASVRTDETGGFAASFANVDPEGGARDVYVRLLASGEGFSIVLLGSNDTQRVETTVQSNVADGALTVDITTNDVDDNHTAFSLHNAMVIARDYLPTVSSIAFPDIEVVFPSFGSFYDGAQLNMLQLDRWDWDVMLHEYGHFIADVLNIEDNPGGRHSGRNNLADDVIDGEIRGKDTGIRLAWGEGWPTYFAVSLLVESNAAALGVPDIGDTSYQDTEDASIDNDLEDDGTVGEDNEVTVMSVLWDLYDDVDDGLDTMALGDVEVWSMLDDGDPETLSDGYGVFAPNGGASSNAANCIFSQMNVAPRLAGAATTPIDASTPSPTLSWTPGNGGIRGENDVFTVEYRNATNGVVLHSSGPISATTYTAPAAAWDAVYNGAGETMRVSVLGTETQLPVTGPYRSCAREFTGGPPAPESLFTSIDPRRFADTRPTGDTLDGDFESDGRRSPGDTYTVDFAGRGDVPDDARAVIANLTAVQARDVGFVTAYDCAEPRPLASSLNYTPSVNLGNEVIVTLNDDGAACFYTSASAHLTIDVVGYVAADSLYRSVDPARLLDTRTGGQETIDNRFQGGGRTFADGEIFVTIAGRGSVPDNAAGAVVNVTAIGADDRGFTTVHPCLGSVPLAASLNYTARVNRGNELIVPVDVDGDICLFTSTPVHLTVDVVGYVPGGTNLQSTEPARFLDTRPTGTTIDGDDQRTGKLAAGEQYELQITGREGVGAATSAVIVNVTAVQPEGTGFVTVHPCEPTLPTASSLNHVDRVNGGNEIIAKLDAQGRLCLFVSNPTHLTVDVTGLLGA